jgi:hypothetical protein
MTWKLRTNIWHQKILYLTGETTTAYIPVLNINKTNVMQSVTNNYHMYYQI